MEHATAHASYRNDSCFSKHAFTVLRSREPVQDAMAASITRTYQGDVFTQFPVAVSETFGTLVRERGALLKTPSSRPLIRQSHSRNQIESRDRFIHLSNVYVDLCVCISFVALKRRPATFAVHCHQSDGASGRERPSRRSQTHSDNSVRENAAIRRRGLSTRNRAR